MSGLAQMYDLKDEKQAQEYLEKVGTEYSFQVSVFVCAALFGRAK